MKNQFTFLSPLLILFLVSSSLFAKKEWVNVKNQNPQAAKVTLLSSDVTSSSIKIEIGGFYKQLVSTSQGEAYSLSLEGTTSILEAGAPDLPKLTVPLVIPDASDMQVEVVASSYVEYTNFEIAPSKGTFTRDIEPTSLPYIYGESYAKDEFYPYAQTELRDPYILRDLRGQTVIVYPFQYNPITKLLRVYTQMEIKLTESSQQTNINVFNRKEGVLTVNKEFKELYMNHFLNAQAALNYSPIDENGRMLIICYGSFMADMTPFVEWKIRKGLQTEMVDVATVGQTSADIKNYITNYYNTKGLMYVLLVGDHTQVPTYKVGKDASDPSYGFLTGNDAYAEVIVGRFSAQTNQDVQIQVQKVLDYEKYPATGLSWYNTGVGIASDQGPGDDNEMDYEHMGNIRSKLFTFTYSNVAELYDGSQGGQDASGDPTASTLRDVINGGVSIINYTGHGSNTAFSTTGFSGSDVSQLTNYKMLPFIWAVACVNGNFTMNGGNCLAESFLRASKNGQPTGAIATLMSSINQYWDEPMEGQDCMNDILIGSDTTQTNRTFGGLSINGCMKMNDAYGSSGADMTETWHVFGDPSIYVRTMDPLNMTVSHVTTSLPGISNLVVNCNYDEALVALTMNDSILGVGVISGGTVDIPFAAVNAYDTIHVTVTAFNKVPYMGDVVIDSPTSLSELTSQESFVYAYDATINELQVRTNGTKIETYVISNSLGQQVSSNLIQLDATNLTLNLHSIATGVYMLTLNTENGIFNKKIFVSNN